MDTLDRRTAVRQGDQARSWPEGFAYCEEVITAEEERALAAQFALLPLAPFAFHGFLGRRRVVSFGWRYDYAGRTLRPSDEIPPLLMPLRERAAAFAGVPAPGLQQVLVTEYAPGAAIGWHRDKPMFEDVIALSFLAPCTLRLRRRHEEGWERRSIELLPRSAYLLRGPARREWEHSIPPVGELRFSVTFRNFTAA
jgi:alkylated DNA repair dioxygenase AlkB